MNTLLEMLLLTTPREEIEAAMNKVADMTLVEKFEVAEKFCTSGFMSDVERERTDAFLLASLQSMFDGRISLAPNIEVEVTFTNAHLSHQDEQGIMHQASSAKVEYTLKCKYYINGTSVYQITDESRFQFQKGMKDLRHNLLTSRRSSIVVGLVTHLIDHRRLYDYPNIADIYKDLLGLSKDKGQESYLDVFKEYMSKELTSTSHPVEDLGSILREWYTKFHAKRPSEVYRDSTHVLIALDNIHKVANAKGTVFRTQKSYFAINYSSGVMKLCSSIETSRVRQRWELQNALCE